MMIGLHDRLNRYALATLLTGAGLTAGAVVARVGWLAAALFTAGTCILVWPVQMSLGLFAASVPFDEVSALPSAGGISVAFVIGALCIIVILGFGLLGRRLTFPEPEVLRWSLFLAWALFSVWWAYDPSAVVARIPTMLSLYLLYLLASSFRVTTDEFRTLMRFTIAGGVVAALLAAYTFNGSGRASLVILHRATDPNVFAASLLLPLSFALAEVVSARKRTEQVLYTAASAAILFAIFITMSRGALVAIVVMIAVYVRKLRWKWPVAAALILAYCSLFFLPRTFIDRIHEAASTAGAGRLYIWQAGLDGFKQYAGVGAGLDNFPIVYQQFAGHGEKFVGTGRDPHNIYLQIGVELGAVGLGLFLWCLYGQFRSLKQAYGPRVRELQLRLIACEAGCWALLAAAFFLNVLWKKPLWLCFIMLALGTRLSAQSVCERAAVTERPNRDAQRPACPGTTPEYRNESLEFERGVSREASFAGAATSLLGSRP